MTTRRGLCAILCFAAAVWGNLAGAEDLSRAKVPNPDAAAEAEAGDRDTVNAAWWGFDPEDATGSIQAAIDTGAATVIVPYMGAPWIIRPVMLRSNLELIFEPGVLVLAKKGEFLGAGDSLFRAVNNENITVSGYGATLRMRKTDYMKPPYPRAEWRMGLSFNGSTNIVVEGLRIESTGGDGIYIGTTGQQQYCKDVVIRDVICHDNHRQGISVIGAENLLIENSVFSNTWGTAPSAGIDLEPDSATQRLVNCVIRNCIFEDNAGHAVLVYLKNLDSSSPPVSIRFENCLSRMGSTAGLGMDDFQDMAMQGWAGFSVGAAGDDNPGGLIEFINCTSENTGKEGVKVYDWARDGVKVRFVNCSFTNPWVSAFRDYAGPRVPILLELRRPEVAASFGGVEFADCHVYDNIYRPVVEFIEPMPGEYGFEDVHGVITLHTPHAAPARTRLGPKMENVTLEVRQEQRGPAYQRRPDADAE